MLSWQRRSGAARRLYQLRDPCVDADDEIDEPVNALFRGTVGAAAGAAQ